MLEHLFNCHGEWTYLLALLDSFPAFRLWISGHFMTETNSQDLDTIQEQQEVKDVVYTRVHTDRDRLYKVAPCGGTGILLAQGLFII